MAKIGENVSIIGNFNSVVSEKTDVRENTQCFFSFNNCNGDLCQFIQASPSDQEIVKRYTAFAIPFHRRDFEENNQNANASLKFSKVDELLQQFENREASLLLITSKENIVAGSFYSIEEDGQIKREGNTLRIQCFSFDRDDQPNNKILYSKTIVNHLFNENEFPHVHQVVVMVRKSSSEIALLKAFGFEADYPYPRPDGYPEDEFDLWGRKTRA